MTQISSPKDKAQENGKLTNSKIEQLKDIIFGENIQEYDSEFEKIKSEIQSKKVELENLITEIKNDLDATIDNLSTDINIRLTDIEDSFSDKLKDLDNNKIDKNSLGQLLISLGEKIAKGQK
ncbi:fructose 1,6-bisphosphatase [Croceitalea vernalis]|uniref:Fructose 1,6-bisphosphatase n=1 Tax=Croceitalea vernalis TaxID=3075599 RepID=A0ABU3BGC4_9FLAO|nr:fructose 1,6-bisphosphatase [Croceitalea sp. P007]MDT0621191.1 fructose 1,6-bisphosphatase [Croceitalea sp. P007]